MLMMMTLLACGVVDVMARSERLSWQYTAVMRVCAPGVFMS